MNNKDWTVIFTTGQDHLAVLAKQFLENEGKTAIIMNKKDSTYLFGSIDLLVDKSDEADCLLLIAQFKEDLDLE